MLRFIRIIVIQSFLRNLPAVKAGQESRYRYLIVLANPDPLPTRGDDQYGVEIC